MTALDPSNLQRGCVGSMPIVWGIPYSHEVPVRVFDRATGDSQFSHMEKRDVIFHIVAPTASLALAHFEHAKPAHVYTRTGEPIPILYLNALVGDIRDYVRLT